MSAKALRVKEKNWSILFENQMAEMNPTVHSDLPGTIKAENTDYD
ncbi:hypothetical protein GCM10009122_04660 [Fulvivirga kasyanovii]|nr:hypothetical protein [Fulvivirga kasyanovii]